MRTITIDNILALHPCYTRERLVSLFGDRIAVTPAEIAAAEIVLAEDRAWVLLRLAPREVWLPAVYRAAERAVRHACWALDSAGLTDAAETLACGAPAIVDEVSAGAAGATARAAGAAAEAAGAAWAAAEAAWAAAEAAGAAAGAAWAAAYQLFLDDLARLVERAD